VVWLELKLVRWFPFISTHSQNTKSNKLTSFGFQPPYRRLQTTSNRISGYLLTSITHFLNSHAPCIMAPWMCTVILALSRGSL
jgi:hypothetical protein